MGLDYTEMLMACEEEFGTPIELSDCGKLQTVGDLYHYILTRLEQRAHGRCLYAAAFFRLRNAIALHADCPKPSIRPDVRIAALLPKSGRGSAWAHIGSTSGLYLPDLKYWVPEGLVVIASILIGLPLGIFGTMGLIVAVLRLAPELKQIEMAAGVIASVVGVVGVFGIPSILFILMQRWSQSRVPSTWTVDAVIRSAMTQYPMFSDATKDAWDSATVWTALKRTIAERLNVAPELVTPEARFVEDLGAD